jgi:hypothetical protein
LTGNFGVGLSGPENRKPPNAADGVEPWPMWFEYLVVTAAAIGGVAIDWYCAYEWLFERYSFWSRPVLERTAMIVLSCAFTGFLTVFWQRGRGRWQAGVAAFFGVSVAFSGYMFMSWVTRK